MGHVIPESPQLLALIGLHDGCQSEEGHFDSYRELLGLRDPYFTKKD